MSLWTPGGEVPVDRSRPERAARAGRAPAAGRPCPTRCWPRPRPPPASTSRPSPPRSGPQLEGMMLEMAEAQARLASAPAAEVLVNHLGGMYELARIHLSQDPPHFDEAAAGHRRPGRACSTRSSDRLGPDGAALRDAVNAAADGLRAAPRASRGSTRSADDRPSPGARSGRPEIDGLVAALVAGHDLERDRGADLDRAACRRRWRCSGRTRARRRRRRRPCRSRRGRRTRPPTRITAPVARISGRSWRSGAR